MAWEERVCVVNFGTFAAGTCNARTTRNLCTSESIDVSALTAPAFKAAKSLRDAVNAHSA